MLSGWLCLGELLGQVHSVVSLGTRLKLSCLTSNLQVDFWPCQAGSR